MKKFLLLVLIALFMGTTAAIAASPATERQGLDTTVIATTLSAGVADIAIAVFAPQALMGIITTATANVGETSFFARFAPGHYQGTITTGDIMVASCTSCHESLTNSERHGTVARLEIPATVAITVLKEKRHGIGKDVAAISDSTGVAPQPVNAGLEISVRHSAEPGLAQERHGVGVIGVTTATGAQAGRG